MSTGPISVDPSRGEGAASNDRKLVAPSQLAARRWQALHEAQHLPPRLPSKPTHVPVQPCHFHRATHCQLHSRRRWPWQGRQCR